MQLNEETLMLAKLKGEIEFNSIYDVDASIPKLLLAGLIEYIEEDPFHFVFRTHVNIGSKESPNVFTRGDLVHVTTGDNAILTKRIKQAIRQVEEE